MCVTENSIGMFFQDIKFGKDSRTAETEVRADGVSNDYHDSQTISLVQQAFE